MSSHLNQPLGGNEMPRFGGPADDDAAAGAGHAEGLDACFVGVPLDIGTSNRPGTRFGPRQIRAESLLDPALQHGHARGALRQPAGGRYRRCRDQHLQPARMHRSSSSRRPIDEHHRAWLHRPLTLGGDHTHRPIRSCARIAQELRAGRHGPCRCPCRHQRHHVRRADRPWHAVPPRGRGGPARQRRACVQIGLRGTGYAADDFDWPRQQGFRVVQAEECWHKSLTPLMAEVRAADGRRAGLSHLRHRQPRSRRSRRAPARRRSAG